MTTQSNLIELVGHIAEAPNMYRESDKVPFARCLFTITQIKRGERNWEAVSAPYSKVVLAYRKLVDLFENLQVNDAVHLRCKTLSKLQEDKSGMVFESNDWVVIAVKALDAETEL